MKSDIGITLMALVIYVIVMMIVIGVMSAILNNFYNNTNNMQADTEDILEFNNFNTYFLKEIKSAGNSVDSIDNEKKYILFTSGNSFSFSNGEVYYNDIEICKGIKKFEILQGKNGNGLDKDIIYVTLGFKNFTKSINYKIEEIY